ncbi:multicopper oxidase domain-containing protein [Limnoraphis robusta]|uniref:Multicopper oxidase domain-containing protein n=1 Tax=Limnoraphis robusta CCNP1315 TaxID=3110306 RepID=A0ABU5U5I5_9CYAN|nr:multicopper oxidase domain-containing protein [Limnoraphis robusta]MEA5522461.1 multicopper oxidase domain-containing protein [Limnoraphis robusta CCNP1315]MEA5546220.1 multicopper oxidase domain-containing protein [Limnoraphis robusta CCNP1324]
MSNLSHYFNTKSWNRRQILTWGLTGLGVTATAALLNSRFKGSSSVQIPPLEEQNEATDINFNPMLILRDFDWGKLKQDQGRTIREFEVTAKSSTLQLNSAISFVSWNLNGRVPGPTLRAKAGERVRILFHNEDGSSHSMHFHGTHPVEMDGVKPVRHGKTEIYEFDAEPYGLHPYHCHVAPVTRHISKGLYGLFIIDPPEGRPAADEMVMVMGGFDVNNNQKNELYAFNGIPNYYRDHPIRIYQNQLVRLYLLNMIEFDPAITFHIHANMFQVYRTGRTLTPNEESDVITMGTAERHILEFSYPYPGRYMFHPHQDAIAEMGCMGYFDVIGT